jgi:hypothetical protein
LSKIIKEVLNETFNSHITHQNVTCWRNIEDSEDCKKYTTYQQGDNARGFGESFLLKFSSIH